MTLVTTHEVLSEVLTFFSGEGRHVRRTVAAFVRSMLGNPSVSVYPQSDRSFLDGLSLYEARPDKGYSLADCVSMQLMRQEDIGEVLTDDDHFTQEGFSRIL